MTVEILQDDFIKMYVSGLQKKYLGYKVEYYDRTLTFIYFYFSDFLRLYVVNGCKHKDSLVQVQEKINIITFFDGKYAKRFKDFLALKTKNDTYFYYLPESFIREVALFISYKRYKQYLNSIYEKYLNRMKNGYFNFDK